MQNSAAKIKNDINFSVKFNVSWIKKILTILAVWCQRSRMRRQLSQLPVYRLEDMGISEEEVIAELQKSFWQQ